MSLDQKMIFYDINYNEIANYFTGTFINTDTVNYAYDNRSDEGVMQFTTWTAGVLRFEYFPVANTTSQYYITDIFINNHNLGAFILQYTTGTTWVTIPGTVFETNYTLSSYHASINTLGVQGVGINVVNSQNSGTNSYVGEFIATRKKFQINKNPSNYMVENVPIGSGQNMWDGKANWREHSNIYSASIGWEYAEGNLSSMTGTDLYNINELARQRVNFLVWPNASNTAGQYPDLWSWRTNDLYKCRITENVNYTSPIPGKLEFMPQNFTIQEHR